MSKEAPRVTDQATDELKQRILDYLATVDKSKNKEVAKKLDADKKSVDRAIGNLAKEGKIEYLYIDASYVTLAKK
jgi:predicted RNA-binding protein (virulence factor B family)